MTSSAKSLYGGDSNFTGSNDSSTPVTNSSSCCECKRFLEDDLADSGVKYWDVALLCPQLLFLVFLVIKLKPSFARLLRSRSPLILLMYVLVWTDTIVAVIRAISAVAMRSSVERGDQVLWLILNFFFVATETAVLAFAVLFGHLDSMKGVRRVVVVSVVAASVNTIIMTTLEFTTPFQTHASFHHGTIPFMAASTAVFLILYVLTLLLPFSPLRDRFLLPSKRSFYIYCAAFVILDSLQLLGACLVIGKVLAGYCLLASTIFVYMTLLPAAVYFVYLRSFFAKSPLAIPFSFDDPNESLNDEEVSGENGSVPSTPFSFPRHLTIQFDSDLNPAAHEVAIVQPGTGANSKAMTVPQQQTILESSLPSMSL